MRLLKKLGFPTLPVCALLLAHIPTPTAADEIRIAVASNFITTMKAIAWAFEQESGHQVMLSSGATGKHFAQIRNGAPFDLFFAADRLRPQKLEAAGAIQPGSRFTYALGKIVLWSPNPGLVDNHGDCLRQASFSHLAVANPRLAPYGKAAEEILRKLGLWQSLAPRLVRGENIGQTFQYVASGAAELGFVAWSQIKQPGQTVAGSVWNIPETLYHPIEQQAVVLSEKPAARTFVTFIKTPQTQHIIRSQGYGIP